MTVKQTGTVLEYRREFIKMVAPLENVPERILMAQFLNGLEVEVKAEVRMKGPSNLDQVVDYAVRAEEKIRVTKASQGKGWSGPSKWASSNNTHKGVTSVGGHSKQT